MYERGLVGPADPAKAAQLRLTAAQEDPSSDTPILPVVNNVAPQTTQTHTTRRIRYYRYIIHNCWPLC